MIVRAKHACSKVGEPTRCELFNDGLMTFFFLLVGLEIKREMVEGQLDTWPRRVLPLVAAFGGMFLPAVIFMAVNFPHPENWRGWAVPTALYPRATRLSSNHLFNSASSRKKFALNILISSYASTNVGIVFIASFQRASAKSGFSSSARR